MNNNRLWSKKEVKALENLWEDPDISNEDIQQVFKNRTWDAICKKASREGLPNRSQVMDAVDWEYYAKLTNEVIEG